MMRMSYDWDEKIEYLRKTRSLYYNDDYLQFLIDKVWQITKPVNMIDFGCGFGYLGLKLLGMLPKGSSYTGIDKGEKLIAEANKLFSQLPYPFQFICADILEAEIRESYDLAICHAVLLHMEHPKHVLQKMKFCVKPGGRVICFESHWIASMSNQYLQETTQSDMVKLGILQKLFEMDLNRTGKDGNIGMKIPVYMSELGMTNIDCRQSDRVNFLDPGTSHRERLYDWLSAEFDSPPDHKTTFIGGLMERGLTPEEAEQQFEAETKFHHYFREHGLDRYMVFAPSMKITCGTVN
jgi:SAM-dependent methyltransferase